MKWRFYIALLIVTAILATSTVHAKDFRIDGAQVTYLIQEDGTVFVSERIDYNLYGCEHNRFRELYLEKPSELEMWNASGECIGAKCSFRIDEPKVSASGWREPVLEIEGGGCGKITAVFRYNVKAVKIYNDTAQFFYKVWGDRWEKPANVKTTILLPGDADKTEHFLHYTEILGPSVGKIDIAEDTIVIESHQPAREMLEINLLMPKEWFKEGGNYYYDLEHRKDDIVMREALDWAYRIGMPILTIVLGIFICLFPGAAFAFFYVKYGHELTPAEAGYDGIYEREPPSDNAPAESIFFISGDREYRGNSLSNALSSAMMSLVNKGYLDLDVGKNDAVIFKITDKYGKGGLAGHEQKLLEYIKGKAGDGKLDMGEFKNNVASTKEFYDFTVGWKSSILSDLKPERHVDRRGHDLAMKYLGGHIVFAMLIIMLSCCSQDIGVLFLLAIAGIVASVALLTFISWSGEIFMSRWTREGRVLNLKWNLSLIHI